MRPFAPAFFAQVLFLALRIGAATVVLPSLGEVAKVVDGDTAVVKADRQDYTVRLIGVDAPEARPSAKLDSDASLSKQDRKTILALGRKSAELARQLCEGRVCRLEYDKANERRGHRDSHGRLLVYLWVKDKRGKPLLINAHVIARGYARALTAFAFDNDYKDQFVRLQQQARVARRGLWARSKDLPWPKLSEATLVGNKRSKKYHRPDCSAVGRMSPHNRVTFDTANDAKAAGYEPCKLCKP
jgi:micrococcal nuclease